jgi:hypothetical protein
MNSKSPKNAMTRLRPKTLKNATTRRHRCCCRHPHPHCYETVTAPASYAQPAQARARSNDRPPAHGNSATPALAMRHLMMCYRSLAGCSRADRKSLRRSRRGQGCNQTDLTTSADALA